MNRNWKHRGGLALALALTCLGFAAPAASAAMQPYTLNETLSLTGDCSTSEADEVHDPDCTGEPPVYPSPPNGPSARFSQPFSVAVDEWGNLYVASLGAKTSEGRIDIFDSEGHFISELADPSGPLSIAVDSKGNLYAYERAGFVSGEREVVRYPPDVYNPAAGEISYDPADRTLIFNEFGFFGLAIDRSSDRLFVADHQEMREYGSALEGNTLKATIKPEGLEFSTFIAIDAQRRLLYTTTCKESNFKCVVWVLDADTHAFIKEINGSNTAAKKFFSTQGNISLAVDETNGHLFVGDLDETDDIYEFDAEDNYSLVSEFEIPGGNTSKPVQSAVADNPKAPDPEDLNPDDNYRHLFVPTARTSGSAVAFEPPEVGPPIIKEATALGIASTEAEVEALVNPKQAIATYEIQYVTETQFEANEWESATVAGSGTIPASNKFQRVSAALAGLSPGTPYRFRVVAENELGEGEDEGTFTTYNDAPITPPTLCPNGPLLTGPSAALPDCRAYELVTPVDTNGGRPSGAGLVGDRFAMVQSRHDGSGVSFEILNGALPGTEATGGFYGDPYLASRSEEGWSTELIGPTGTEASKPQPGSISPDQGHVFWTAEGTGTAMTPGNAATHYVRYPDDHSELVGRGSLAEDPWAVGRLITDEGTHIVFETTNDFGEEIKLEPAAPPTGTGAVYDRTPDEVTHVVSLLPGNITPTETASYVGASPDGEGIAFSVGDTLYLRKDNTTTYEIEEGLITAQAFLKEEKEGLTFAGVSAGGERIFYVKDGDLEAFETETEDVITFADTAARVIPVNIAPAGNRAYFVSESAIVGSGPNAAGDQPQAGEQNLYFSEGEGTPTFIATVTERDVEGLFIEGTGVELDGLGLLLVGLEKRQKAIYPSRTSTDGGVFVFHSRADLADYDSGEDPQIYRYEASSESLACLSCPPTKVAPSGGALLQSVVSTDVAAPLSQVGFVPSLAKDGERVFFESTEALVSTDTNSARDVYEWEEEGIGSCKRPGGCVYLISSGRGGGDSYLFGHSDSGDDVFFTTNDILVSGDESTLSIYDARVGGGFAAVPEGACPHTEECRPALTSSPALPVVKSDVLGLSGNVEPGKRRCPRTKRAIKRGGKTVCVKKKKQRRAGKRRGKRG